MKEGATHCGHKIWSRFGREACARRIGEYWETGMDVRPPFLLKSTIKNNVLT